MHTPKVDMTRVSLDTIKPWVTQRITEILGFEDDVVIEFVFNLLEKHQVSRQRGWQRLVSHPLPGLSSSTSLPPSLPPSLPIALPPIHSYPSSHFSSVLSLSLSHVFLPSCHTLPPSHPSSLPFTLKLPPSSHFSSVLSLSLPFTISRLPPISSHPPSESLPPPLPPSLPPPHPPPFSSSQTPSRCSST